MPLDERRKHRRFRVRPGESFVVSPQWPANGEVVDICEGGFAFIYEDGTPWDTAMGSEAMLFGAHESSLQGMPMVTVADRALKSGNDSGHGRVRRRSVRFGPLSARQQFLLECFIWINAVPAEQ